jgi:hypothetical protein
LPATANLFSKLKTNNHSFYPKISIMSKITKDAAKRVKQNYEEEAIDLSSASSGNGEIISAVLQQYKALKARYPEAVLLFRVGDCYEAFGEDAVTLHDVLGLRFTKRGNSDIMSRQTGFKAAALDGHLTQLVKAGHKVAVCDKLEDPPTFRDPVRLPPAMPYCSR